MVEATLLPYGLLCGDPPEPIGRFHLAAQPFRRDVEAVRPGQRTEFEKHARKISLVPQWFERGARLLDHRGEIVHGFAAVVEPNAQPKTPELFKAGHFSQHQSDA
jgi:hypothetical protein